MSEENVNPAAPAPAPAAPAPKTKTSQDELATKLCVASLICYFSPILLTILAMPLYMLSENSSTDGAVNLILLPIGLVISLGPIAAIILMIIARAKSPKNTFGKVLMWIYISLFILKMIAAIIITIFLTASLASCMSHPY